MHSSGVYAVKKYGLVTPLENEQALTIGTAHIMVMHTPGHIDDAVCFYIEADSASNGAPNLITGDTLFVGGCGRTNSQGVKKLFESLQAIKTLPLETVIYPGHDYGDTPVSTMQHELAHNKYYLVDSFESFSNLRLS